MSLSIYKEVSTGTYVVHQSLLDPPDSNFLPVVTTHDGTLGEIVEIKLFVRNDDPTEYYENIVITPVCTTSPDDTIGTATGHGVKLYRRGSLASDIQPQPTEAEWEAIDYGTSITMPNIGISGFGDTASYLGFWYRVECPAGAKAANLENIVLRISFVAQPV